MAPTLAVADVTGQDVGVSSGGSDESGDFFAGAGSRRFPLPQLAPHPGCLLVAAPILTEATFVQTVLYVLEHDESGTAAVILNRPSRTPVGQVLPDWHDAVSGPNVIFSGGPVQPDGALCLGLLSEFGRTQLEAGELDGDIDGDVVGDSGKLAVRPVVDAICTVDLDGAVEPATAATSSLRVFAGHAGWSPGQLDGELEAGAWFVLPGRALDVFAESPEWLRRDVLRRQPSPLNLLSTYSRDPSLN
jgi:putative transcriptional regulator